MRSFLLTAILIAVTAATAAAQVPRTISFQGRARDAAGAFPDDERTMTIRIFDAATGGTSLFNESHNVQFQRGAFTIIIGGNTSGGIPNRVAFDRPLWLELAIENFNGGAPLTPRLQFHSAPSAIAAINAANAINATNATSARTADSLKPGSVVPGEHFEAADTIGSAVAPDPGTIYRDNAPIAWGLVADDGTLLGDFGIESVTKTGVGQYQVLLDNSAIIVALPKGRNVPLLAPVVQPSLLTDVGPPLSAQWAFQPGIPTSDRQITVLTTVMQSSAPVPYDAAFSIIVFGRPTK